MTDTAAGERLPAGDRPGSHRPAPSPCTRSSTPTTRPSVPRSANDGSGADDPAFAPHPDPEGRAGDGGRRGDRRRPADPRRPRVVGFAEPLRARAHQRHVVVASALRRSAGGHLLRARRAAVAHRGDARRLDTDGGARPIPRPRLWPEPWRGRILPLCGGGGRGPGSDPAARRRSRGCAPRGSNSAGRPVFPGCDAFPMSLAADGWSKRPVFSRRRPGMECKGLTRCENAPGAALRPKLCASPVGLELRRLGGGWRYR